jgi:hypothetical protein
MHKREEKEPSVFAQGIAGWKMLFNAVKRKKPEQQKQEGENLQSANQ